METTDALPLCTGETLGIQVEDNTYSSYDWNNGSSATSNITVANAGSYNVSVTNNSSCIGVSSLFKVEFDDTNCNNTCSSSLNLFGTHLSDTYNVTDVLQSSGLVRSNREVIFNSENHILLETGFEVQSNAVFEVDISDCPNN